MSDHEPENGEDAIDESGRNLTQQEIDERGASDRPADVEWDDEGGTGADDGGPGSTNM